MSNYLQVSTTIMSAAYNRVAEMNINGWHGRDFGSYCALATNKITWVHDRNYTTYVEVPEEAWLVRSFEFNQSTPRYEIVDMRGTMKKRAKSLDEARDLMAVLISKFERGEDMENSRDVTAREGSFGLATRTAYLLNSVPEHLRVGVVEDLIDAIREGHVPGVAAYAVDVWPDAAGQAIVAYTPIAEEHVVDWVRSHQYKYAAVVTFQMT